MSSPIRESKYFSPHDLLFGFLAGITGVAGSYALAGNSRQFIVAPIDALIVSVTPGQLIAIVIQTLGDHGHLLHIALALSIAVGVLAGIAEIGLFVARRYQQPVLGVCLAGALTWLLTSLLTGARFSALGAAAPVLICTAVGLSPSGESGHVPSRRRVLVSSASALAFVAVAVGLGRSPSETTPEATPAEEIDEEAATLMDEAAAKSLNIHGDVPGLVSTFAEFYNVDIAEFDPDLSPDDWSLTFTGEVGADRTITFEELLDQPTERRFVTLRCVGESLNGKKLDTAVWTGTPINPLLEEIDPGGECGCAMLHAEDGYYVQFPLAALKDGFLAWGMNGRTLPQSHGHPVRILIPGHWGETNVKWLTEIELLEEELDGYWERKGWHGTGPVNTVAKLWSDTLLDNGNIEVAGHAYAGTRGIQQVEVSTDGGSTWQDAELSDPLPGNDVWRQWRYEFAQDGTHEVIVRAIDGDGNLQAKEQSDAFPSGATGWVSKTITG